MKVRAVQPPKSDCNLLHKQDDFFVFAVSVVFLVANMPESYEDGLRKPTIYVSLYPPIDSRERVATSPVGDECHPFFDKVFKFPVSRDQLIDKELVFIMHDCDKSRTVSVSGEARVKLDDVLKTSNKIEVCGNLPAYNSN